jgi:pilus assembly protein FimV
MSLDLGELAAGEPEEDEIIPLPEVDLDASVSTVKDDDAAIEELAAELESFDLTSFDSSDEISTLSSESNELEVNDEVLLPEEESLEDLSAELDEIDDVTTKIDLARAYIEMGDKEGAKGILEEVIEEGSEAQKQQAQALIAGM